ncbi:MAG: hypothetical protein QXO65_03480 [Candidatus Aenigmatarchaeota archaeon]
MKNTEKDEKVFLLDLIKTNKKLEKKFKNKFITSLSKSYNRLYNIKRPLKHSEIDEIYAEPVSYYNILKFLNNDREILEIFAGNFEINHDIR